MNRFLIPLLAVGMGATVFSPHLRAQQPQPVYGTFGQRTLTDTLRPQRGPSLFTGGSLMRGPSGNFYGINANYDGAMFRGMPWQYSRPPVQGFDLSLPGVVVTLPPPQGAAEVAPAPEPPSLVPSSPVQPPLAPMRVPAGAPVGPAAPTSGAASVATPQWTLAAVGLPATASSSAAAAKVQQQLSHIAQIRKLTPITVTSQGDATVLRGAVASQYDRTLAEDIARLQPGIDLVVNELTVP